MNMEMKWSMIAIICLIGIPMAGLGIEKYQVNQCRIEAIKANLEPEKISQVCR